MTTLPRTGATELVQGQVTPETSVNEITRYLDANATRAIIEDRDLTAPPVSCADGACYLVKATATGAWASKDGKLAIAVGANASNGWLFMTVATEGYVLYIKDEDTEVRHNGTGWGAGANSFSTAANVWAGTGSGTIIDPPTLHAAHVPQVLTDGATVAWDMAAGFNARVTLGGNRTLGAPTNPKEGMTYVLEVIQDATGSRTLTWPAAFNWGSAGAPTLSTGANKVDIVTLYCRDAATPKFRAVFNKDS